MVKQRERPAQELAGSKAEQAFATNLLNLLLARGMFMSANAPIRVSVVSLADYLEGQGEKAASDRIFAAVSANPAVFAIEDVDGGPYVLTTRDGRAPTIAAPDARHTFAARFRTP